MRYSLTIGSAVLYAGAYLVPAYCWWGIFIFLVPIFYLVMHKKLALGDGLVWSSVTWSLQFFGIAEGLFLHAQGSLLTRSIVPVMALSTAICYGTVWLYLLQRAGRAVNGFRRMALLVSITWLFFLFLERSSLWMFGIIEGYLLVNPLVPLIEYPILLYGIAPCRSSVYLLCFIALQAGVSVLIIKKWYTGLLLVPVVLAWLVFVDTHHVHDITLKNRVVCGSAYFTQHESVRYGGYVIGNYCKALLKTFPEAEIVLFPETAVRCPFLPAEEQIVALLGAQNVGKPITIITGGCRWDGDTYRNTVYWIHDGTLVDLFDKRHAMAVTERSPQEYFLGSWSVIKESYFKKAVGISPSTRKRPVWQVAPGVTIIPYICSELYFNNNPDHEAYDGAVIVALCNDDWVKREFMRYQMLLGARFRAVQWQVPILYVAYHYQALCLPNGSYYKLKAFDRLF